MTLAPADPPVGSRWRNHRSKRVVRVTHHRTTTVQTRGGGTCPVRMVHWQVVDGARSPSSASVDWFVSHYERVD